MSLTSEDILKAVLHKQQEEIKNCKTPLCVAIKPQLTATHNPDYTRRNTVIFIVAVWLGYMPDSGNVEAPKRRKNSLGTGNFHCTHFADAKHARLKVLGDPKPIGLARRRLERTTARQHSCTQQHIHNVTNSAGSSDVDCGDDDDDDDDGAASSTSAWHVHWCWGTHSRALSGCGVESERTNERGSQ